MNMSEKIQYSRRRAGLSQEQLADRLGISRQAVSKWETGEAMPDATKLAPLAKALGVSVDWLLTEDDEQFSPPREDWSDRLPRQLRYFVKRWGYLAGVYLAVVGAIIAGMGLLARFMASQMIGSMTMLSSLGYGSFMRSNPVSIMGAFMVAIGLVICAAGIVLAVVLKRKSKD